MSYGIVEYNEQGQPKCEICNEYFDVVTRHAYYSHGILAKEYKIKFGLNINSGVVSNIMKKQFQKQGLQQCEKHPDWAKNGNRFVKGHIGRPKEMLSEQARLTYQALARDLGKSGIGNQIKYRYKSTLFNKKISSKEILKLYKGLNGWCQAYFKENYDEDLASEVILIVAQKRKLVLTVPIFTYLCAVAKKQFLIKQKHNQKHGFVLNEDMTKFDDTITPNYELKGVFELESKNTITTIKQCINELPVRQQEIIKYKLQGLSNEQIQKETGFNSDYVKSLIWFSRKTLKQKLQQHGISPR